ncbi:MAG TPA: hypothetical protein VEL73_05090 [Mycobacteriales bacterium]|nr:hypothetical protein [Mycobacteriales bacterium]
MSGIASSAGTATSRAVTQCPHALDVAAEVARIASAPAAVEDRAVALLEPLHRIVPFEGAWIAVLDPERDVYLPLLDGSAAAPLQAYFRTPAANEELELVGLSRPRPPLCLRDSPVPPEETVAWMDYLWPAGFQEGLAVGLFAPDGRHVGFLGLLTDTTAHPTDAARDLVGVLAPTIASAIDRLPALATAARMVSRALAGVVLTGAGRTMPLPGLAQHRLLTRESPVTAVAADLVSGGASHGSFLCPAGDRDQPDRHLRVTVLSCTREPPDHLRAVVLLSAAGELYGLTPVELRLLGLLIEDWPDARIGAALGIPDSAVAGHVETISARVRAPSRAIAVLRALRHGLYVPRALGCD